MNYLQYHRNLEFGATIVLNGETKFGYFSLVDDKFRILQVNLDKNITDQIYDLIDLPNFIPNRPIDLDVINFREIISERHPFASPALNKLYTEITTLSYISRLLPIIDGLNYPILKISYEIANMPIPLINSSNDVDQALQKLEKLTFCNINQISGGKS